MIREPLRRGIALLLSYLLTVSLSGCHQENTPAESTGLSASRPESSAGSNADSSQPAETTAPSGYLVLFESAGGSPVESVTVKLGDQVQKPADPVKEGFRFTGWTLSGNPYDFHTPVGSDLLLIAGWERDGSAEIFIVFYNSAGGTKLPSVEVSQGYSVNPPVDPVRPGYRFLGWFQDGEKYDFSKPVTANTVLKARWEELPQGFDSSSAPSVYSSPSLPSAPAESSQPGSQSKWTWEEIAGSWFLTGTDDVTVAFTLRDGDYTITTSNFDLYPMPRLRYLSGGGNAYPAVDEDVTDFAEYVGFARKGAALVFQGDGVAWTFYRQKNYPNHIKYYLEKLYNNLPGTWYLQGSDRITVTITQGVASWNGEKGLEFYYENLEQIGINQVNGGGFVQYYWIESHMEKMGMTYQNDTITINKDGQKATFVRTPTPKRVTGVRLDKTTLAAELGQGGYLYAQVEPADASNLRCTWKSSDPSVVTVDAAGMYSFHKAGTAVITVTTEDGGFQASCTVTVLPYAVRDIARDKSSLSLEAGQEETLNATITPWNAANQELIWESTDPAVAKIRPNGKTGKVVAVAEGTTVITVTTKDGGYQASCTVSVRDRPLTLTVDMSYSLILGGGHAGTAITLNGGGQGGWGSYSYNVRLYRDGVLVDESLNLDSLSNYAYYTAQKGEYRAEVTLQDGRGRTAVETASYILDK